MPVSPQADSEEDPRLETSGVGKNPESSALLFGGDVGARDAAIDQERGAVHVVGER